MDAERYARLRALYDAVVDLPAAQRAAALAAQQVDAAISGEVLDLCAASDADHSRALDGPRDALLREASRPPPVIGDVIGVWRLAAEIGHGGMGRVYRVERSDGHFVQTAALKFIKGIAPSGAITLFTRERQLLAQLNHPGIAGLIDGGTASGGQPYLVMDYIDGVAIDVWCADRRPGRDAVLGLFVAVCAAVSHAHRQLIVHCDLKPSNILVADNGQPVLLDFGIAQLVGRLGSDDGDPAPAAAGYTPRYASPEQRRGEPIGMASDVYSLGIVLAEMLAAAGVKVGGELAAIIAKASHAEAARRYATVDALGDDLARLQSRRPVQALPASPAYRLRKFLHRRWSAVGLAMAIAALCTSFTLQLLDERQRALDAEQRALAERDRAQQAASEARASESAARETSAFLISVFSGASPDVGSGTVSIATLLDQALGRVDSDLADQPATQAQMLATLARALLVIGQSERGRELYARAIAQERRQPRPLVLAQMLIDRADALRRDQPTAVKADDVFEALALIDRHAVADSPLHLELSLTAGSILGQLGRAEAGPLLDRVLQRARREHPQSAVLARVLGTSGWQHRRAGRLDLAIPLMRESLALRLRLHGDAHAEYVAELEVLAGTLALARRFDEAEPLFRQAIDLHRRDGRLESRKGAWALAQYATTLAAMGRALDALPLYEQAFAIGARKHPDDSNTLRVWTHNLADVMLAAGDWQRAHELVDAAIGRVGAPTRSLARSLILKARILVETGCDGDAGAAAEAALRILQPTGAADDRERFDALIEQARWQIACGDYAAAAAALQGVAAAGDTLAPLPALRFAQAHAQLRLARDGDEAALDSLQASERLAQATFVVGDARAALAKLPRARWLAATQRRSEAAALARHILAELDGKLVAHSPWLAALHTLAADVPTDAVTATSR